MDKPITVARKEFLDNLVELINTSKLPAFMIVDVFESTLPALRTQAEQQYLADLKKWKEGDTNGEQKN